MVESSENVSKAGGIQTEGGAKTMQLIMVICGASLVFVGGFCLVYAVWIVVANGTDPTELEKYISRGASPLIAFFLANSAAMVLILSGICAGLLGTNLMGKSVSVTAQTIGERDRRLLEPLITGANEEAISQYVRISSLTGLTGFFTKLGFTGLPLATAGLGVLLIFLAILQEGTIASDLMDLAKLVIGAFIGSFVQRKVGKSGSSLPEDNL